MKLGNYAHISISVRSLRESAQFYEQLGFKKLWGNIEPHPWALYTDGRLNIHLYEFFFPSPALHYFSAKMHDTVLELMRLGSKPELQKSKDGNRKQHNFLDPNELCIMLMHYSEIDMPKPTGESHSRLGVFGEFSINTDDLKASLDFWQKLDFAPTLHSETPYPWSNITDGVMTISLHQTRTFATPALAYFTSDVSARLLELTEAGVSYTNISNVSEGKSQGAILNAPDGQVIFLLHGAG